MPKELENDVKKAKKMICEQNWNTNEDTENLKKKPQRNYKAGKYNNWNENFAKGIQRQMWVGRRKNQGTWRQKNENYGVWERKWKKIEEKSTQPKESVGTPASGPTYALWES